MKATPNQRRFALRSTVMVVKFSLYGAVTLGVLAACGGSDDEEIAQPVMGARAKPLMTLDGRQFKDSNANGKLDAYEDWRLPVDQRIDDLVAQMTLEEKAGLCSGADFWHLKGVERLGIPGVMVSDGPHGLRKQDQEADHLGINDSIKAVCFPAACATAASFDEALESLVELHPQKDYILKASGNSGGGSHQSQHQAGQKTMKRAAFDALPPAEQQAAIGGGTSIVD